MTTLTWNGTDLPAELRDLPAGRYVITGVGDTAPLTPEEEEAVRLGLEQADRGELLEHEDVIRSVRARLRQ